jgi:hypothetical protein
MTDKPQTPEPRTPAEALAAAVARRKAQGPAGGKAYPGARQSEQAAAHRSASKSKPALRK